MLLDCDDNLRYKTCFSPRMHCVTVPNLAPILHQLAPIISITYSDRFSTLLQSFQNPKVHVLTVAWCGYLLLTSSQKDLIKAILNHTESFSTYDNKIHFYTTITPVLSCPFNITQFIQALRVDYLDDLTPIYCFKDLSDSISTFLREHLWNRM